MKSEKTSKPKPIQSSPYDDNYNANLLSGVRKSYKK